MPFLAILTTVLSVLVFTYVKGYKEFFSPLTLIAIIFGYYCVLGPYQAIDAGDTYDRLRNMRPFYVSALWGAFVALLCYILGFFLHGRTTMVTRLPLLPNDVLLAYGKKTFLAGFILFTISTGGNVGKLINPLDAEYVQQVGGSFGNYFGLALNFVIPGITLLFLYFIITRKALLWFVIPFIVSAGIFITLGFRYRLVLLIASIGIVYYLTMKKRPNLVFISAALFLFIALMGIINLSRQYGSGLDMKKLEGKDTEGYYKSGLRESLIFQTSGAIIDIVPERHPYAGFTPLISTLTFPIPSAIYSGKESAKYLFDALDAIYGKKISQGSAVMSYAEYYLAFGWMGIVIGCFLIGWFYRKLWNWYLANQGNPLAIATYAVTVSYLYVIISRGYLPQVTMLFFFTVYPVFAVLYFAKKKYKKHSTPTIARA